MRDVRVCENEVDMVIPKIVVLTEPSYGLFNVFVLLLTLLGNYIYIVCYTYL